MHDCLNAHFVYKQSLYSFYENVTSTIEMNIGLSPSSR